MENWLRVRSIWASIREIADVRLENKDVMVREKEDRMIWETKKDERYGKEEEKNVFVLH